MRLSCPVIQSLTWLQYKNANRLKYSLATTLFLVMNLLALVVLSDLIKLTPRCTILADREFKHIYTLLSKKRIELLRSLGISMDIKLTKQEPFKIKVVASLRICVERVKNEERLLQLWKLHSVINNKFIKHAKGYCCKEVHKYV